MDFNSTASQELRARIDAYLSRASSELGKAEFEIALKLRNPELDAETRRYLQTQYKIARAASQVILS